MRPWVQIPVGCPGFFLLVGSCAHFLPQYSKLCTCMYAQYLRLITFSPGNFCPLCGECYSDSDYDAKVQVVASFGDRHDCVVTATTVW